jgi:hypothetical protein
MKYKDFPFLNAQRSLEMWRRPSQVESIGIESAEYYYGSTLAWITTLVDFLKDAELLPESAPAWHTPVEKITIMLSDLTEEGQDFVMTAATSKWLGSLDRKSNDMLKRGASNEERLLVGRDPKGLYKRLDKFRKERIADIN